jgi:hypothetical protein
VAEIDDGALQQLQQAYLLLDKMNRDPKARTHVENALKAVMPEYQTEDERVSVLAKPYIEQVEGVSKRLEERLAEIDKREQEAKDATERASIERGFADLLSKGYTDEGIEGVKKTMVDLGLANVNAAAVIYEHNQPKAPVEIDVSSIEPDHFAFEGESEGKANDWFTDPERASRKAIAETLNELRRASAS